MAVPSAALGGPGVVSASGKPRIPLGQAAGGATPSFSDHGGPVIAHVHLYLVFWGTTWNSTGANPSMGQVTDAVINILTGPYMQSLSQYRQIGSGFLEGVSLVSSAVGSSPASPPASFTNTDVSTLLTNLIAAGQLPDPSRDAELLYMVMLAPGASQPGLLGEHTFIDHNGTNLHFGWVANGGSLSSVTWVFSHELVESVTDPEGSAITGTGCNQSGWCEIGDVCTANTAVINGVTVQRYWSQVDGQCVVPTDGIVKQDKDNADTKIHKDVKDHKEHKVEVKEHKLEVKEHKLEPKEVKDAKEKELERPPLPLKPAESIAELGQAVAALSDQVSRLIGGLSGMGGAPREQEPTAEPFITAGDRPPVGERIIDEAGVV